uniref:Tetraspanin n=1 Tax=Panagrellus redivivus TaxID=6233 RepID=A0A7E4ZPW6_PANRE
MVYGCGNNFVKFIVFLVNLLLFVFGSLICGFSLWANLDKNFAVHLSDFARQVKINEEFVDDLAKYQASLWVLVGVGALLLVVGFLGCCGAACESMICLALQFIVVLLLSIVQIIALGYLLVNRAELLSSLQNFMEQSAGTVEGRMNLLPIQNVLHCCGATANTRPTFIAEGRCVNTLTDAPDCYSIISEKLETAGETVVAVGILCLIVEFVSLIFTCVLFRAFRDRETLYTPY